MPLSVLHPSSSPLCNFNHLPPKPNAYHPPPISVCKCRFRTLRVTAAALVANEDTASTFPLFQPPSPPQPTPASQLEPADPDFYKIGYVRSMRAYGIEFREGPDGFGVYASKDIEPLRRARVIMEIPLELMLTISQKLPWMFFPDIIPVGHPIFDIINSTNPELYGDFLPSADECTSLLLATEDQELATAMREQQQRALEFWERNWHSAAPLKVKRLAREPERFMWALSMAQSRCINKQIRIGALVQDANMLVPYAG
ncbi:UNVERIFIED_CONTAM: protein PLASTID TRANSCRIPTIONALLY ACTIVE 14 [Sesamum radiatum]|uniref:Protein PLASTID TRANSCRIPTIONALLY ACTIVE 14 n=1 Tax=Sesamum radiatum TaxID=300843 RepID=A0AAW2T057_SESRA